ncbi:MAG: aspartate dehydrogenase domain-containing protein [Xanthomonadales bacterium]|nr:aspartate dehydrogenase domain-containing protein [Xanthomonadales bacterium]
MMTAQYQIGIIGFGFIGSSLYKALSATDINVASVLDPDSEEMAALPAAIGTTDRARFLESAGSLDLVVEVAHPQVTVSMGHDVLRKTSYMPCSMVALANDELLDSLLTTARECGTQLFIPHGAVAGMDNFLDCREKWQSAEVTFRKPPTSIDKGGEHEGGEVVLFEGSARDIAEMFPRSVNSMVTFALATLGLDNTLTRIIADPSLDKMLVGEFKAVGKDGSRLTVFKNEPAVGVSSTGMVDSIKGSVIRALGAAIKGPRFV